MKRWRLLEKKRNLLNKLGSIDRYSILQDKHLELQGEHLNLQDEHLLLMNKFVDYIK